MSRSIGHNAVMNVVLVASNTLATMITVPYVSRVLTVEGNGAVSFAQSTAIWFQVFCVIGIASYGIRECARVRDNRERLSILTLELLEIISVCTALSLIAFALSILFIPAFRANGLLMWVFLINTLVSAFGVEWFYQATEDFNYIVVRSVIIKILSVILIVLLVRKSEDYVIYGILLAFGTCANNVFNIIRLTRLIHLPKDFRLSDLHPSRHLKALSYFTVMNIATSMYLSFDTILLSVLSPGNYQTGLYQLAAKLKSFILMAITAIVNVITPRMSYLTRDGESGEYISLLKQSFSFLFTLSLAICAYMIVFARPVVIFISSDQFIDAVPSVRIAGLVVFVVSLSNILGPLILIPNNREKTFSIACLASMPVSLLLNLVLDGHYGAVGASIAILCTECVSFFIQAWACRKELKKDISVREISKSIIACAVAVLASILQLNFLPSDSSIITLLESIPIFGLTWVVMLILLKEPSMRLITNKITQTHPRHSK